ncbi:MAG: hypothetical protein H6Q05_1868 [Acidobacteria bacterium]|nr:hypothetical protein [Acidobacteriota bacterium]
MAIADELERLHRLHQSGALSVEEFRAAKASLIDAGQGGDSCRNAAPDIELRTRQWAMFLHFSFLAAFALPVVGLVAPILIWQLKKEELPAIDIHGKMVVNWILSLIIYAVISALLVLVIVGIPLLMTLGVVSFVFPIIAGIKANNGEIWNYPMSLVFLK